MNARGLDLRLRLPEVAAGLDPVARQTVAKRLFRGSVTLSLRLTADEGRETVDTGAPQLDHILTQLHGIADRAAEMGIALASPTAADVLTLLDRSSGGETTLDPALRDALTRGLDEALRAALRMRDSEGAALATIIAGQLDEIETLTIRATGEAAARAETTRAALTDALRRVVEDVTEIDETRIAQELALLAVKQDVTEELDRLTAHIQAGRALLGESGPVGRKLDFLAQEFNREANTLCSKAQDKALTSTGLALKAAIEQMREQIQNVE